MSLESRKCPGKFVSISIKNGLIISDPKKKKRKKWYVFPRSPLWKIGPNTKAISAAMRPERLGENGTQRWSHMLGVF
jgi:hypothetical protein